MKKKVLFSLLSCIYFMSHAVLTEISLEQIFNTTRVETESELQQLNRSCKDLDLALVFKRVDETNEIEAYINYHGNMLSIPHEILQSIYTHLNLIDSHFMTTTKVRVYDKNNLISPEEAAATNIRLQKCHNALEKLLDQKIDPAATPRIAVCGSGGGLRATISTAGFLKGLDEDGFLDVTLYQAGLSGSTWCITPYMISQYDHFKDFYPILIDRIVNGFMKKPPKEMLEDIAESFPTIAELILRKLIFKDRPTIIDIYGFCLGESLFHDDYSIFHTGLQTQQQFVAQGQRPYPIYTAIVPHTADTAFDWLTFSPYEVACDAYTSGVPSWAFCRAYEKGTSTNRAPHLPLCFCIGLFGSAISVSFEEFYNLVLISLKPQSIFNNQFIKDLAQPSELGDVRVFPAVIKNFTYEMSNLPRNTIESNIIVDAGIDINLPLPPLLNPGRDLDIIIICDASGDVLGAPELRKAQIYAFEHQMPFPAIDYTNITNKPFSVFDDGPNSSAPIIIYVPMIQNQNYSTSFNPQNYLGNTGFLGTFNFDYNADQAHLLSGLLEESVHELKPTLLQVLKTVIQRKS